MNPVDRNLAREIGRWCIVLQVCTSVIFLMTQFARLAPLFSGGWAGGGWWQAVLLALVPIWLWTLLPSFMLSIFIVAGTMAQKGELTSLHAAGVSPLRISRWPAMVGVALFLFSAWMSIWAVPQAQRKFQTSAHQLLYRSLLGALEKGTFVRPLDGVLFFAGSKYSETGFFGVYLEREIDGRAQLIVAEQAEIIADTQTAQLRILLKNGEIFLPGNNFTVMSFRSLALQLPVGHAMRKKSEFMSETDAAPTAQLWQRVQSQKGSRTEIFEFYRRVSHPVVFLAAALLSIAMAFNVFWRRRSVAIGVCLLIFIASQVLSRGGAVWMRAGVLSPQIAAFLAPAVLVGGVLIYCATALYKNRRNSLYKNVVSCR